MKLRLLSVMRRSAAPEVTMSVKTKALLSMISVIVVVSFVYTWESINTEKEIIRKEIIKRAEVITSLATKNGELPILSGSMVHLKDTVRFLKTRSDVSSVTFYDGGMTVLIHDGPAASGRLPFLKPEAPVTISEEKDFFVFYSPVFTERMHDDADILYETDGSRTVREHIGWVRLGFSKAPMRDAEKRIVERGILLLLLFTSGSSALVYFLISLATRPLSGIVKVADEIADGDFSRELDTRRHDEIGVLSLAFQRMKNTIQQVLLETEGLVLAVREGRLDNRGNAEPFRGEWRKLVYGVNHLTDAFAKGAMELQEAKDSLEKRVEERTAELALANSELLAEIAERAKAENALAERVTLAELSADIGYALAKQGELGSMLKECSEALVRRLDAAFARIWTLNADENVLELQAGAGMYTRIDGSHSRVPVGKFKIGLIAAERAPYVTNTVIGDPRVHDQEWAKREGLVSFAGHPLTVEDKLVGVVAMFSRNPVTDVTSKALASISNEIAIGIERKRGEEELSRLNRELEQRVVERTRAAENKSSELRESQFALMNIVEDLNFKTEELELLNKSLQDEIKRRIQAQEEASWLNEDLVKQKRALEAANRELEAFSYSVSHDLRAPLRAIDGFSQAVLEDYGEHLGAEGKDYLRRMRAASQRMGQLIDDILSLSRLSRLEMRSDEVDLSALVRAVAADLRQAHPDRKIDVVVPDGITARCDARLMLIAFENLLGNAWKFTAGKPDARIEFGSFREGDGTVYFLRDNGVGFDMAYADKLFKPFQRLHTVEEFPGTGIGLATVLRVINRHRGSIRAEAEIGKGATFYFSL